MAYSLDFRGKVLSVREKEGFTIAKIADRFSIGVTSVVLWIKNVGLNPIEHNEVQAKALRKQHNQTIDMLFKSQAS